MGCHTWFYQRVERTQQEAKESCLNKLRYAEELNLNILQDRNYEGIDWSYWSDDMLLKKDAVIKRHIRMVENDIYPEAVWHHQNDEKLTCYVEGKGLYMNTKYHDLFRKYGYPDHRLYSLEETLEYLDNPTNECEFNDESIVRLKEFWNEYPDGMIQFG